ncbi:hypothetical protein EBU02_10920 [bacterium]|nr:hypothetical protein [bacterium]
MLLHHLRCKLIDDLARQSPIDPRVGTARRRRPTPAPQAPLNQKSGSISPLRSLRVKSAPKLTAAAGVASTDSSTLLI